MVGKISCVSGVQVPNPNSYQILAPVPAGAFYFLRLLIHYVNKPIHGSFSLCVCLRMPVFVGAPVYDSATHAAMNPGSKDSGSVQ